MKVYTMTYRTHNPYEESHGVSRLRENLTSGCMSSKGWCIQRDKALKGKSWKPFSLGSSGGRNEAAEVYRRSLL
ncbi:MAG TPA: hypothetical protein VMW91_00715 [Desulfosporosinus sp.]|nr:hypothetical protein [Desulfosporosinus sp.]